MNIPSFIKFWRKIPAKRSKNSGGIFRYFGPVFRLLRTHKFSNVIDTTATGATSILSISCYTGHFCFFFEMSSNRTSPKYKSDVRFLLNQFRNFRKEIQFSILISRILYIKSPPLPSPELRNSSIRNYLQRNESDLE